jgi:hypothetical protein
MDHSTRSCISDSKRGGKDLNKKIRIIGAIVIAALWIILTAFSWFLPAKEISEAERRPLAQFPELTVESILNGKFTSEFEKYTLDQFPMSDAFRQAKSIFHYYILNQKDNNDIYVNDGYAAKMEYPLSSSSIANANKVFDKIYNKYLKNTNTNVFFSVVPDKGYYLAEESGHLTMDYEALFNSMKNIEWAEYIDLTDILSIESYYYTDTHWRQEKILPVVQKLCEAMGADIPMADNFTMELVNKPFYGVYYGQAALPMTPEDLYILNNDSIKSCVVLDYETNKNVSVYDEGAVNDKDLYDTYLHGAKALLKIENPNATTDKELIIFRDSFGSSIAPLMVDSYKTITIVDLRYISSVVLGNFIDFENQDVLFLYSTLVLNNSFSLK